MIETFRQKGLKELFETGKSAKVDAKLRRRCLDVLDALDAANSLNDLNLPGFSGLELIKRLTLEKTAARILVLSMHDEPIYAMRALQAGAAGYVSKDVPPAQLLEAIRRVAEGQSYLGHELAQELALSKLRAPAHPLEDLSPRDLELLRLLAEGSSLQQIADALGISYKTVANNCTQMKAKLGARRTADLVRIAVKNDLVTGSPAAADGPD